MSKYPVQIKKLLDILSQDGVLVNGRVNYSNTTKQAFWKNVAFQLNRVENGVHKNTLQWWKVRCNYLLMVNILRIPSLLNKKINVVFIIGLGRLEMQSDKKSKYFT